jgi:TAP-like protein
LLPVLLLADPKDTLVPVDTARRLAQALPDARLQLVEGAGHHLPRRAPDVVASAIAAFVAECDAIAMMPGRAVRAGLLPVRYRAAEVSASRLAR